MIETEITENTAQYYSARGNILTPEQTITRARVMGRARYQAALKGHDVLELACGKGHMTAAIAVTARSVLATDLHPRLVAMTQERIASFHNVRCQEADAYTLEGIEGPFTAAFFQLWWSHIPRARMRSFLTNLHSKLSPGALVIFSDALPWCIDEPRHIDAEGNLLERRTLPDGSKFEIIKNFPSEWELAGVLSGISEQLTYRQYPDEGMWAVCYRTKVQ